jgi:hypothetical protein
VSAIDTAGDGFDPLSWHDCHVWGIALRAGDAESGDWTSDLVLDIDYIVEWICAADGGARFRVAPATLVFHGATDLRVAVEQETQGAQVALHPWSIDRIERASVAEQKVYLDRPYYRWRIALNWPRGGEIEFGAWGFTQALRAEPVVSGRQLLTRLQREPAQE